MVAILVFVLSVLNVSFALNSSDTITDIINTSTCLIGNDCRDCPEDRVEVIERNGFSFKVCCPNCGPNLYIPGTLVGDILCNCPVYEGNCWTGRQCEECFHGPNRSNIGLVDGIYLCCPNCRWSGKNITFGNPSRCDCHFRDEKEAPDNENDPNDWNNIKDPRERMDHILKEHQKIIDDHEKASKVLEELKSFGSLRSMQDNMYAMPYGGSDRKGSTMQDLKETEYVDDGDDDDVYNDYYAIFDDDYDDDDDDDDDDDL